MTPSGFQPVARRLAIEVALPSLVVSVIMTGVVYLARLPSPQPAEASEVTAQGVEGLRAVDAEADDAVPEDAGPNLPGSSEATKGKYRLRVGVFSVLSNAVQLAERLRADGYRPEVIPRTSSSGQDLYFLYVASFDDEAQAQSMADRLRSQGQDVYIEEDPLPTG